MNIKENLKDYFLTEKQ